jgi:hypothetical protein
MNHLYSHGIVALCRCATRCNFLSSARDLAALFYEPFQGINYDRFLKHVETCPDPMCGRVFNVDGTCKVFREICGAPLPLPEEYNAAESDVQNVVHRDILRQKRCDNMPHRIRQDGHVFCLDCQRRFETERVIGKDSLTSLLPDANPTPAQGPMTRTTRQTSALSETHANPAVDNLHNPAVDNLHDPADDAGETDSLQEDQEHTTDMVRTRLTFKLTYTAYNICFEKYNNVHEQHADRLHISWDVSGVQNQCTKEAAI